MLPWEWTHTQSALNTKIFSFSPITPFSGRLDAHDRAFRCFLSVSPVGSSTQARLLGDFITKVAFYMKRILDVVLTTLSVAFLFSGFFLGWLYADQRASGENHLEFIFSAVFVGLSMGYIFWRTWQKEQLKTITGKEKLKGIRGWLVLPLLGILFSTFNVLNEASSPVGYSIAILYLVVLVAFLWKFKIAISLTLIFLFTNFLLSLSIGSGVEVMRDTALLVLWGLYFVKSVRVRQTFVRTLSSTEEKA